MLLRRTNSSNINLSISSILHSASTTSFKNIVFPFGVRTTKLILASSSNFLLLLLSLIPNDFKVRCWKAVASLSLSVSLSLTSTLYNDDGNTNLILPKGIPLILCIFCCNVEIRYVGWHCNQKYSPDGCFRIVNGKLFLLVLQSFFFAFFSSSTVDAFNPSSSLVFFFLLLLLLEDDTFVVVVITFHPPFVVPVRLVLFVCNPS